MKVLKNVPSSFLCNWHDRPGNSTAAFSRVTIHKSSCDHFQFLPNDFPFNTLFFRSNLPFLLFQSGSNIADSRCYRFEQPCKRSYLKILSQFSPSSAQFFHVLGQYQLNIFHTFTFGGGAISRLHSIGH